MACGLSHATGSEASNWRVEQGLPHNAVERLLFARDGWLWIGTRDGLARFDGLHFTVFNAETPGFTSDAILDIAEDAEGHLWIATKRGAYRYADGKFAPLASSDGLISDHVSQIYSERGGGLWFATAKGLSRLAGGTFQNFPFTTPVTNANGGTEDVHYVHSVRVDRDGGIRVGADGGLHRLSSEDGSYRREWMESGPSTTLYPGVVRVLHEDRAGRTWWATDRQLVRQTGTNLTAVSLPVLASDNRARRIVEDSTTNLWVVHSGALFRVAENGAPIANSAGRIGDTDHAGSEIGASPRSGDLELTLERMELKPGLSDEYVTDFLEDREGTLWVGTRYGGLHQLRRPRLKLFTTKDGLPHNTVHTVSPAKAGGVWVGSESGAGRWHGSNYHPLVIDGVTNIAHCRTIFEDSLGSLWLAARLSGFHARSAIDSALLSERAAAELPKEALIFEPLGDALFHCEPGVRRMTARSGPSLSTSTAIFEDHSRRIWLGHTEGVGCLLTNEVRHAAYPDRGRLLPLHRKRADGWWFDGNSTVLDRGLEIYSFNAAGWVHTTFGNRVEFGPDVPWPDELKGSAPLELGLRLPNYFVRCFAEDAEGILWFGTRGGGLHRVVGQKIETFTTVHGLAGNVVETLHVDRSGVLWTGTRNGLSRIVRSPAFTRPGSAEARTPGAAERRALPGFGVGQNSGSDAHRFIGSLARGVHAASSGLAGNTPKRAEARAPSPLDGATFHISSLTTRHGLPDDQIHQIIEDRLGHFWLAGRAGIFRVRCADLDAALDGRIEKVDGLLLDESDGLLTTETSNQTQPVGCVDGAGAVWLATRQGLARIEPEHVRKNERPPPVFVEQLRAAGQPRLAKPVEGSPEASLNLPPGSGRSVEIHFTALGYTAPEKLRFRYRLEGFDAQAAEVHTRRVAYYTNLKPGTYRFHVAAANRDGVWNETGATLAFAIQPYFHETWTFRAIVAGVLLTAVGIAYRIRMRAAQEGQRAQVTKAMHDALAGKLSAIAKAADALGAAGSSGSDEERQRAGIAQIARAALRSLRQTSALHDPACDTLDGLVTQLIQLFEETFPPLEIPFRLDVPVEIPPQRVAPRVREQVVLLFSEVVNNVVRHADATLVHLRVELHPDRVCFEIWDNGRGFVPEMEQGPGHSGLGHLRERAAAIQGELIIRSAPGQSTVVRLTVKVRNLI